MPSTAARLLLGSDRATFLPSLSNAFVQQVSQPDHAVRGGALPPGLTAVRDLDPLDATSPLLHHPTVLYSAGQAEPDPALASQRESCLHRRARTNTLVVLDSGGYQLLTGKLPPAWGDAGAVLDGLEDLTLDPFSLRDRILRRMEATADVGLILDFPTAGIAEPRSVIFRRYHRAGEQRMFRECLHGTRCNAHYAVRHRQPGATLLLNVLQGRNPHEQATWWDNIKAYSDRRAWQEQALEGFAFAGNLKADPEALCRRLLAMADGGYLTAGELVPLHFLGIARLEAAVLYTFLQRALRRHVNPNIAVTYDAASPFVAASRGEGYVGWTLGPTRLGLRTVALPRKLGGLADRAAPWPQRASTLGRRLTVGDLCVNPPRAGGSTWDTFSYALVMHMNLETHLGALEAALALADDDRAAGHRLPATCFEFRDAVDEIVRTGAMAAIDKHRPLFRRLLAGIVTRPSPRSLRSTFGRPAVAAARTLVPVSLAALAEWELDERHEAPRRR